MYQPACELPAARLLRAPDAVHQRRPVQPHRAGGDLRAGALGAHVPDAGRGDREGEQHALRPVGRASGPRRAAGSCAMVQRAEGRRRVGEHLQPLRPDVARSAATRSRASGARAACTACSPTSGWRTADGRDVEAPTVRRRSLAADAGAAPAAARSPSARPTSCTSAASSRARSRAARTSSRAPTARRSRTRCRASRKDVRDAVRAARGASAGWAGKTAMNRGQVLYRVAELMEGRREQFADEVAAAEGLARRRRARASSTARSTAGSGTRAGRTRSPRCWARSNPVGAPYFNFSIPEPTGVVGRRRARALVAAGPRVAARAGRSSAATPRSCSRPSRGRCRP